MKYMIQNFASQHDYDNVSPTSTDWVALVAFMEKFNADLIESGELVETRGLAAPVHARRLQWRGGAAVATDGPYAETQEVLAGYWIVECESFDRATAIAAHLMTCPGPDEVRASAFVDVRPLVDSRADLEI